MIQLAEMRETRPMTIHDGVVSTTTDVWDMLSAARDGDLARVKELAQRCPALLTCQYDYTAPLHLAIREGHLDLVRYLVAHGALDPDYKTHPFLESLITVTDDRGYDAIAQFLKESLNDSGVTRERGDTGKIDHGMDETQRRFQELVDRSEYAEVEAMLKERPELARNELAFWGEGILSAPANGGDQQMLELLMGYGASVPDLSKWGERYYFKHYNIAVFLMESGMNPNHMNWHHTTLLHDKAFRGDLQKVRMLLDYGADINAVDEEFRSTPLGFAARWGRREIVALLLERGANPNKSGAPWAAPLAWARKKGHAEVEADLLQAGAQ
jgi:ankyrin repeat protein